MLALEHADGSACSVEMADGSIMEFKGLGVGPMLEAKVVYRTAECRTALKLLKALHEGEGCGTKPCKVVWAALHAQNGCMRLREQ